MDAVREYLIGVSAAGLLCAVVVKLRPNGAAGEILKLMAGIFMALAVVSPWTDIRLEGLTDYVGDIRAEADALAEEGENSAREAMAERISQAASTYILDKAAELGLEVTVEVALSADDIPVPEAVTVRGSVSPYTKQVMSQYISDNLGIGTEAQTWIQS